VASVSPIHTYLQRPCRCGKSEISRRVSSVMYDVKNAVIYPREKRIFTLRVCSCDTCLGTYRVRIPTARVVPTFSFWSILVFYLTNICVLTRKEWILSRLDISIFVDTCRKCKTHSQT